MSAENSKNPYLVHDLQRAFDYLESHGWCQGSFYSGGKVCLDGALMRGVDSNGVLRATVAEDLRPRLRAARGAVLNAISRVDGKYEGLWDWNDAPERTVGEVKEMLQDAISHEAKVVVPA